LGIITIIAGIITAIYWPGKMIIQTDS
jgi:hypothetical protein